MGVSPVPSSETCSNYPHTSLIFLYRYRYTVVAMSTVTWLFIMRGVVTHSPYL